MICGRSRRRGWSSPVDPSIHPSIHPSSMHDASTQHADTTKGVRTLPSFFCTYSRIAGVTSMLFPVTWILNVAVSCMRGSCLCESQGVSRWTDGRTDGSPTQPSACMHTHT